MNQFYSARVWHSYNRSSPNLEVQSRTFASIRPDYVIGSSPNPLLKEASVDGESITIPSEQRNIDSSETKAPSPAVGLTSPNLAEVDQEPLFSKGTSERAVSPQDVERVLQMAGRGRESQAAM